MWIIEGRPTLRKALNDAAKTVAHSRGLDGSDQAKLEALYRLYEAKQGRLDAADLAPLEAKKSVIKIQYPKTYGKGELSYIRRDLMKDIDRCPMCSILPVTDLDHFWNESQYGQLAVCRLNLIPTCGKCNKAKSNSSPDDYIHAYYQPFPNGVVFLKASCKVVRGYVIPTFSIDGSGLGEATLSQRLHSQIDGIRLKDRLRAATKEYMRALFQGTRFNTDRALRAFLISAETKLTKEIGLNDWRTALVRGLRTCPDFDIAVVQNYRRSTKRTRDGRV